jgi:hypothetical protein
MLNDICGGELDALGLVGRKLLGLIKREPLKKRGEAAASGERSVHIRRCRLPRLRSANTTATPPFTLPPWQNSLGSRMECEKNSESVPGTSI